MCRTNTVNLCRVYGTCLRADIVKLKFPLNIRTTVGWSTQPGLSAHILYTQCERVPVICCRSAKTDPWGGERYLNGCRPSPVYFGFRFFSLCFCVWCLRWVCSAISLRFCICCLKGLLCALALSLFFVSILACMSSSISFLL